MQHSSQLVEFYNRARLSQNLTAQNGYPTYEDCVFVRIHNPGDLKNVYDQPAEDGDKRRFPEAWARFVAEDSRPAGVPVETLTGLHPDKFSPADVENLKAQKVLTVEQLSGLDDQAIRVLGPVSREWVKVAQSFLARSDVSAMEAENARLRAEMDELKAQMADLVQKRKGGRPPKVKSDEPADNRAEHV